MNVLRQSRRSWEAAEGQHLKHSTQYNMTVAVFSSLLLSACSNPTPPIARGLPKSFGSTPDFDNRINQRYPVGSDEAKLLAELRSERFTITESHDASGRNQRSALYESNRFPCKETWTIRWVYEHGIINAVEGRDSGVLCL